jgi:hypothetical protein
MNNDIETKIDALREELNTLLLDHNPLDKEALLKSQELDKLIVIAQVRLIDIN